ncbi:MAG TPA: trypsin-like peptidase domain-containing protein [Streptosporangiaceae bacterium]|jgi:putative serine protease PepD|nr:trypsin-like peptidase domain-containing protein [Streptosporangiaceae bacterium]
MSEGPGAELRDSQPGWTAPGAPAGGPAYPADDPADLDYSVDGAQGRRWGLRHWSRRGWDRRARRLALGGLAIAVVSALVGGLLGGFIATRSEGSGIAPGYSLGRLPRVTTRRPGNSVAGIAARILPSVVMIRVNGSDGTGSGFVIPGGYIITNNHVVTLDGNSSSASVQVVFQSGLTVSARLVGRDTYSDIAVIKPVGVHIRDLHPLALGNSAGLAVGDPVIAFGAPLGLAGTVTSGIVSALDRPVQPGAGNGPAAPQVFLEAIQTDAPINPGNSGGPLVNSQGQVIGVNAAFDTVGGSMLTGQGGNIGLGFAIPIDQVRRVAVQLIRTGHATHAVIGALLNTRYHGTGAQIAVSAKSALAVTPGGPAARAGLRPGDVIISFAGQPVNDDQTLLDAIRARSPGSEVRLIYLARGKTYTTVLRLGTARS